jgi:hypothetical protein
VFYGYVGVGEGLRPGMLTLTCKGQGGPSTYYASQSLAPSPHLKHELYLSHELERTPESESDFQNSNWVCFGCPVVTFAHPHFREDARLHASLAVQLRHFTEHWMLDLADVLLPLWH